MPPARPGRRGARRRRPPPPQRERPRRADADPDAGRAPRGPAERRALAGLPRPGPPAGGGARDDPPGAARGAPRRAATPGATPRGVGSPAGRGTRDRARRLLGRERAGEPGAYDG